MCIGNDDDDNVGIEHIYMQRSAGQNTLYIALKTQKNTAQKNTYNKE